MPLLIESLPPPTSAQLVTERAEMRRILDLPVASPLTPGEVSEVSSLTLASHCPRGFSLLPEQAAAVTHFCLTGGLFAPMGCGKGKTLTTLIMASLTLAPEAFPDLVAPFKAERVVLLIPPQLRYQLLCRDIQWARQRIPFPFDVFDLSRANRVEVVKRGLRGLYVLPYSTLSTPTGEETLSRLAPDFIIADEAHSLSRPTSARTKRFLHLFKQRPGIRFAALSGTMTRKRPLDYAHLVKLALKDGSPLPEGFMTLNTWSSAIEASPQDYMQEKMRLSPLVEWGKARKAVTDNTETQLREAFSHRLRSTFGVVASDEADIGTTLYYDQVIAPKAGASLEGISKDLETKWITPNGDEIEHAIVAFKWRRQLSMGFYSSLQWPESHPHLEQAKELHHLTNEYHKALRTFFASRHRPGLDTPFLVGKAISQGTAPVPEDLARLWKMVHTMSTEATENKWPVRVSTPVRVDDFKVRTAVETARKWDGTGILWFYHNEVAWWLKELMPEAVIVLAGDSKPLYDPRNRIVIASIAAFGTGQNLQHYHNHLFVEGFGNAVTAEQAVSRSHRTGQTLDELTMQILMGTRFDDAALASVLNDACYIDATVSRQKAMYCPWKFVPALYDSATLRGMGADVQSLTAAMKSTLTEKFK